jgi:Protein of unknown function (DUF3341)
MEHSKSVFGIYLGRDAAERAVDELRDAGYSRDNISMLWPEDLEEKEMVMDQNTKAPEGVAVGAGSGAALGGALGWLVGIGALAIPGIGPVVAAGPIVAAVAGMGLGGAVGGFAGVLVGVGIPEHEAAKYEGRIVEGGILVAVRCEAVEAAKRILEDTGAEDVACSGNMPATCVLVETGKT